MLDKSKPYALVTGHTENGVRYIQDGIEYKGDGSLCNGQTVKVKAAQDAMMAEVPEPPAATADAAVDYDGMHHMVLKKMVKEAGGEYLDRDQAIEFLKSR